MTISSLVLATRNPHKTAELRALLAPAGVDVLGLDAFPPYPEVVEDGATLEDNALKKAREAHRRCGLPAVADDTGLEVYYLLGAPGVYSARYAGEQASYADNNRKLLRAMVQVPARKRGARFRCVMALVADGLERSFEGRIEGRIGLELRGGNGFGYDPLFYPADGERSYAELTAEEKNAISHRARAAAALQEFLIKLR
jgi:XTP/dITP diphosphohydrolase